MSNESKIDLWLSPNFDILAVFCLGILPDLVRSFLVSSATVTHQYSLNTLLWMLIVRSLQVCLPILLIMKLRKVNWSAYGFLKVRPLWDTLMTLSLVVLAYAAYYLLAISLLVAGFDFSSDPNGLTKMTQSPYLGIGSILLVFAASCANGFAEELVMRSYLITRLRELNCSAFAAAIVTTVCFAAYHCYQGRYGIINAFAVGAVFSTYFVIRQRFWPIATAHALMDFIPIMFMFRHSSG